jgi:hypothetical protein
LAIKEGLALCLWSWDAGPLWDSSPHAEIELTPHSGGECDAKLECIYGAFDINNKRSTSSTIGITWLKSALLRNAPDTTQYVLEHTVTQSLCRDTTEEREGTSTPEARVTRTYVNFIPETFHLDERRKRGDVNCTGFLVQLQIFSAVRHENLTMAISCLFTCILMIMTLRSVIMMMAALRYRALDCHFKVPLRGPRGGVL